MDFTILLLVPPVLIFVAVILYSLFRAKANSNALVKVAERLGFKKFSRIWISKVILHGKVDNCDTTLEGSFDAYGASLTLTLQYPTTHQIRIRQSRHFFNLDVEDLLNIHKQPLKLGDSTDKQFQVFSSDVFIARKIFSDPYIKRLLDQCIQNQKDTLDISHGEIVLQHLVSATSFLFVEVDNELLELELNAMWNLMSSISSLLKEAAIKSEALICPFCRDSLKKETTLIQCEECSTVFHEGCWNENGRTCAVFKCASVVGNILQSRN